MHDEFQGSTILSMISKSFLDIDKMLLTSRQSKFEACNSRIKRLDNLSMDYDKLDQHCIELKNKKSEKLKRLNFEKEELMQVIQMKQSEENELMKQILLTKNLLREKVSSVPEDELSDLFQKVSIIKGEIETKRKAIINDVAQFKNGHFFYKKYLLCDIIYEQNDQVIFTLDLSAKNVSVAHEFIRFTAKNNATTFEYVEMQPKLKVEQRLVQWYKETGNIQGFILLFWKAVKMLKGRQNNCGRN